MARSTWGLLSLVILMELRWTIGNHNQSFHNESATKKSSELEQIIREKTEAKIKELEQQFKNIYMKFSSTNGKHKKKPEDERYLEDITKVAKQRIEYRTGETVANLRSRRKRSDKFGSCQPICRHRCIDSCNFACCIPPPVRMPLETIFSMERIAAKKLKHHRRSKAASSDKKSLISKADMEKGSICKSSCQKHCVPSCKFRCCMKKH